MTIFEQQIDPSQVTLEWTTPATITLIILGGAILALWSGVTLPRRQKDESNTETIKGALVHAIVGTLCFIGTSAVITNPLSIDKFTQPAFSQTPGERVPLDFTQNDKQHIADMYHNDINAAIDNEFSSYDFDNTTESDQQSVLNGGKLEEPVLATKDGTTYTLTPEWDYNHSNHTVKLTVTTQEGDHREK